MKSLWMILTAMLLTASAAVYAASTTTIDVTSYTDLGISTSVTADTVHNTVLSIAVDNNSADRVEYDLVSCSDNSVLQSFVWNPGESSSKALNPVVSYVVTSETNRSGQLLTVLTSPCWTERAF